MATRNSDVTKAALLAKGFREHLKKDHHYYYFYVSGKKSVVYTKVSRGPTHPIGKGLFSHMARQCGLVTPEFCDLIDCGLTEPEYRALLLERKKI